MKCILVLLNIDLGKVQVLLDLVHDVVWNAGLKALDKCLAKLLPHVYAEVLRHCIQELVEANNHGLIDSPILSLRNEEDQNICIAWDHKGEIFQILHEKVTEALDHLVHGG